MTERKPTLLVVDDVVANIDILIEALGKDYTVRVDTDGAAALGSVKEALPDLILLDIMMPGMDGFEVCRRLKADPTACDIPIIFLTALNEDADEARGLELGAVDYITKPFNPHIVKTRVRNHLELKRHRDHLSALVAERTSELAKANERLLELGRIKDDFLKMISHEMCTPANGLLGIGQLIIDMCPPSEECALYRDLFQQSSLRLQNLIEDTAMIADIENMSLKGCAAISFTMLLDKVRASLQDIKIPEISQLSCEPIFIQGERTLLARALKEIILLAISFCREKHIVHIAGEVEARGFRLRLDLDDLSLTEGQAAEFFDISSSVRGSSTAQALGLAPVVASKIICAFGGQIRLVKGSGRTGYLEVILLREQGQS